MDNEERQRQIHETVVRIDERQESFGKRLDEHVEDMLELRQTVYGNGAAGLTTEVALLKAHIERKRRLKSALVGAALSIVVGFVLWILTR